MLPAVGAATVEQVDTDEGFLAEARLPDRCCTIDTMAACSSHWLKKSPDKFGTAGAAGFKPCTGMLTMAGSSIAEALIKIIRLVVRRRPFAGRVDVDAQRERRFTG